MIQTDRAYCPYCMEEVLEAAFLCRNCGRDLHAIRIAYTKTKNPFKADDYHIVPDGSKFGIEFGGEVILHGMDKHKASITARILNDVMRAEKAG